MTGCTLRLMGLSSTRVAGAFILAWCLVASVSGLVDAVGRDRDPIGDFDAEFSVFGPQLPARGVVGYLEAYDGEGVPEAVRVYYAAQYALVPRVVVGRVGPEFLVVARGTARGDDDPRLSAYTRIAVFPTGHRLYRRVQ